MAEHHPSEAEAFFKRALTLIQKAVPPVPRRIASVEIGLGRALMQQERYREAKEFLDHALTILRTSKGSDDPLTREAQQLLNEVQKASNRKARTLSPEGTN